jgi:predicted RNA-binding protein
LHAGAAFPNTLRRSFMNIDDDIAQIEDYLRDWIQQSDAACEYLVESKESGNKNKYFEDLLEYLKIMVLKEQDKEFVLDMPLRFAMYLDILIDVRTDQYGDFSVGDGGDVNWKEVIRILEANDKVEAIDCIMAVKKIIPGSRVVEIKKTDKKSLVF